MSAISNDSTSAMPDSKAARGVMSALTCFILWGVFPLYIHILNYMPSAQIVAHRIFWSLPLAVLILIFMNTDLKAFKSKLTVKTFFCYFLTAALIGANWSIYVWAINNGYGLDASLAYYISPLINVILGCIFYKERLVPLQWVGVGLSFLAVLILFTHGIGSIAVIVFLPFCLSFYAAAHRNLPLHPTQSFFLEVLILSIPACLYLLYTTSGSGGYFIHGTWSLRLLLFGSAIFTAVPLLFYALSVKYVSLSTVGILQYISPTLIFLASYFVFKEQVDPRNWISYGILWVGIFIYIYSTIRVQKMQQKVKL